MDNFNAKKYKLIIYITLPVFALILIGLVVFLPIKFLGSAVSRQEAQKGVKYEKLIDKDLIKGL